MGKFSSLLHLQDRARKIKVSNDVIMMDASENWLETWTFAI